MTTSTRAIVIHAPHDLRIDELELAPPGPGEVEINLANGGICGSDLHYYHDGGFGSVRLREPLTLGHEASGYVSRVGEGVNDSWLGQLVAINPSQPCGQCRFCQRGWQNHCLDMRFNGSAMRFPHIQGIFRERLITPIKQCWAVPKGTTAAEAALAEPFSVALHAVRQAGDIFGRRVLVTGAGPIGALTTLAARMAGAGEITVTDMAPQPLERVKRMGADHVVDITQENALEALAERDGTFDVVLEASGASAAQRQAIGLMTPRGTMVAIGIGGETALPMSLLSARELTLRGTFRFHEEFGLAVKQLASQREALREVVTQTVSFEQADDAFQLASDRGRALKVQLTFS